MKFSVAQILIRIRARTRFPRLPLNLNNKGMSLFFSFLLPALISTFWSLGANAQIRCEYKYYGVLFSTVIVKTRADGSFVETIEVIDQAGNSHSEPLTVIAPNQNEKFHFWISKDFPDRAIEMIVLKDDTNDGNSKLINHNMPIGKEIWGICQ